MSDLFHSFVFDLQRFATQEGSAHYSELGGYSWAGGTSLVILKFPTDVVAANSTTVNFSYSTVGGKSTINEVFKVLPTTTKTEIGGLSFYAQEGGTGVTAFFVNASGSVYFGSFSSGQPQQFNFGDNDKLFLTENAVENFNNGKTLLYKGQSLSALGLETLTFNNGIAGISSTGLTTDSKNLQALGGSAFQFNGLSANDGFTLTEEINVEFEGSKTDDGSPNAKKATAGGDVAFNTKGQITSATVESGGILAITGQSAGLTQDLTINNVDIQLETSGLAYDNTGASAVVYMTDINFGEDATTENQGASSVYGATIAGEQFSLRGLDTDYNGFVLNGSNSVGGFVFASDETEATLIFAPGEEPDEDFTVYNGAVSGGSAYALPTVVDAGDVGVAIVKYTEDDEAQFALVGGSGAQVKDADGDTNITYTAAAASYFAEFVFNASGSLLGVKPGDNFLTGNEAPTKFQKDTKFDVTGNVAASAADGLFFGATDNKVALASGSYVYGIDDAYVQLKAQDDTVYSAADATKIYGVAGEDNSVTDNINGNDATYDYKSGGSAYFTADGASGIVGFGFVSEGDAIGASSLKEGFGLEYYDSASDSAVAITADISIDGTSKAWIEMTQADGAEFEVNNFGGSAVIGLSSAQFTFDADTAAALQFSASGIALGFNATSGTVTMNQDAAAYMAGGSFEINDVAVDIEAAGVGASGVVFEADDDGEQSLFGLGTGTKINNAGDITKIYGASGADNELTVGSASFVYTAVGASKADRAFFTVAGSTATGFTFQEVGDALTLGKTTPESFELTNGETENPFDAPVVYESEDSQDVVDAYTVTKVGSASFEMSGFSEGNYTVFEPTEITFQKLNGTSAAIAFEESSEITGINKLAVDDEVKVANPEGAINFDDATVEILGTSASFVYHKTGAASSILEDVSANVLISQLGGASQVITAAGQSGNFVFTEGGGQTFGVYNYSYSGYADVPGGYSAADISGVQFNIGSGSKVTSIADISEKEWVEGDADAFAAVKEINGQAFGVSGAEYIAALGTSSGEALGGLFLEDGASVAVNAVAGAPAVLVVDIDAISFGEGKAFTIAGTDASPISPDTTKAEIVFNLNGMSVVGIDDIGAQESITGNFDGVLTANGVSFAVDGDDEFMIVGTSIAEGIGIIANVSDSASILNVGGASYVITDEEGTFTFAGHSVAFQVEGDSSVTFQMVDGAAASVAGVKDFYATGDSIAVLTGELIGLTINDSEKDIDVTGDEDNSFAYMVDASGNATLGGVGASSADAEVVITGTGGASTVNVISDGVYTFNISGTSTTFTLDIADDDTDGVNFVLDADGNVTAITSFDKGDVITGSFSTTIDFAGLNGTSTAETSVQVLGDSSITVEHDAYIIKDVSDLATIKTADGIVLAITDTLGANDTLQVTDTDGDTFVMAGSDSNGVQLILDGAANIVGVSSLDTGVTLGGDLGALSSINGKDFGILEIADPEYLKAGDGKYSVVGAASGIGEFVGLSGIVFVADAGGASVLRSDGNIALINFAGASAQAFAVVGFSGTGADPTDIEVGQSDGANFYLGTSGAVEAIDGIGEKEVLVGFDFADVTVNGKELKVTGDDDELALLGSGSGAAGDGITAILGVGGSAGVLIEETAGASYVLTNMATEITFGASGATFDVAGDSSIVTVQFTIEGLSVTAIAGISANESVTGDFTGVETANTKSFDVTDADKELMVVGTETQDAIGIIAMVSASATITDVAGASQVITDKNGIFTFASASQVFEVHEGDNSVTFGMSGNAVNAITGLSFGVVISENFDGVSVNGKTIDIVGDEGGLAIGALSEDGIDVIALVGGASGVTINDAGGASYVVTDMTGTFTFASASQTFTTAGDSQVTFVLDSTGKVTAIYNADKGASITGDFSEAIAFEGYSSEYTAGASAVTATVQVLNDTDVMVVHDGFEVHMLSNGAKITSATTVYDAYTDSVGGTSTLTVTDASGDQFVVAGDSNGVHYLLDGAGEIIGVEDLDADATLGGALSALKTINGKTFGITEIPDADYLKAGDGLFSVVGAAGSAIGEVIGLSGVVIVENAGGASVLRSDGNIFLANEAGGQSFMAFGGVSRSTVMAASDGVNFYLTGDSVTAIDGIGGEEVVLGTSFDGVEKLNGKEFKVVNDADALAVLGRDGEDGIYAVIGAGNGDGATIETAAGASFVLSDSDGVLTFGAGSAAKTFELVTNEASIGVGFYINDSVQVQAIDYLDKADMVIGDFTEAISVNGEAIQATDDVDQKIIVIGSESWKGVSKLAVQANATVTSWGSASAVDASGEGNYVFIGADGDTQTFTAADTSDSRFTFVTDKNDVTGIAGLSEGYVNFQTSETSALDVNIAQYPGQTMTFDTASNVSLSIDPYEVVKVEGVTGSVSGIVGTDTPATVVGVSGITKITVNGKPIEVIEDGTTQFNVIVHDTDPDYVYDVQGDATVNAENVSVRANSTGSKHASENAFVIGGETYTMDDSKDENDGFTFVTGASGIMTAVASLEGALIIDDGEWDGTINGGEFSVAGASTNSVPVTVNSGVDGIESVGGLEDGDSVAGALSKAQVRVPGYDDTVWINGKPFNVIGDDDGVDVTGEDSDVITDLDNEASLTGPDYPVTVNGTALEPEDGDIIKGRYDKTDAYILDTAHQLIRKSTALYHGHDDGFNIEDISGLPYSYNFAGILDREETDSIASGSSTLDLDQPLSFLMDNVDEDGDTLKTEQVLDLSGYEYTKRVTLWDGDQAIKFNDEGGNFARVSSIATGVKNISLGAGGDAVVMDEDYALQNAVNIYGGAGKDSIYVRHSANTTIDLSAGGEDIIVTAGEAEARITLAGYQASTGAAIRVEEYLDDTNTKAGTIADGIENGTINFAEGLVIIESPEGRSEINVGTNGDGGQIVNLMTHATSGNDIPQAVGFTGADGGSVDGSAYDSPLIMIGNKDNTDSEGSILRGGSANDTFYGGQDDLINTGAGNDLVKLYEDDTRGGAYVEIGDGRTTIEGMNNTLADSTGDTLGVAIDPQDGTFSLLYNDELQALEISSSADGYYALLEDVDTLEGGYTTQYIYDSNADTLYSVAIGTEGSVIEVTEDEDLRPNVFFGYNTAIDFRNYTGDAIIDLRGDLEESIIDETIVIIDDDITTLYAGEGEMAFKGDLDNETFYAGKGDTWLYGDGGKNLLVGYDGDDKEGQTVFYVLGNEDGAAHTIAGFNFVNDDNYTDNKKVTADMLEFDFENNDLTRLEISGNDLLVEVTDKPGDDTESGLILGAINDDGTGNDMIVSGVVAQVADDKLVFDQFADFYYAAGKNATVEVSSAIEDDVVLWLDDDDTGKNFEGDIKVIDARKSDATAQLAGNDNDNVIYAGTGETSLWGGEGGNDLLVGNSGGRDTFYYSFGNGDDTITNVKDGDLVALDVSLDQIDEIDMSDATAIRIIMNDGDVLTINDAGHDVGVMIDNGEGGVDTYSTAEARRQQ